MCKSKTKTKQIPLQSIRMVYTGRVIIRGPTNKMNFKKVKLQ